MNRFYTYNIFIYVIYVYVFNLLYMYKIALFHYERVGGWRRWKRVILRGSGDLQIFSDWFMTLMIVELKKKSLFIYEGSFFDLQITNSKK